MGDNGNRLYVGLDVGGTNITAALVEETGAIQARKRNRTPRTGPPEAVLERMIETIEQVLTKGKARAKDLTAIGVGIPGIVDLSEGRVALAPNVNLTGLVVAKPIEKRLGVPVALGNDVDVGTLGEFWLGAARGARSVVGIFPGTGIGGGVIIDGRLVRGASNMAAEIGHIVIQIDGPLCGCGNRGCLEALASRSAIERDIRQAVESGRESVVTEILDGDLSQIRSKALKQALAREDAVVTEVMQRASEVLGQACLTVRHLLDPEVIVLGGGVIEACGAFIMPIIQRVLDEDHLMAVPPRGRLVQSVLGDDASALGAVAMAREFVGRPVIPADGEPLPMYPVLASAGVGAVIVNGETCENDVVIRAGGKVKKRKKKAVKEKYGTSHKIGPEELEKVLKGTPETLVIGTGYEGAVELTKAGKALLKERGVAATALPTPEAVTAFNNAPGRKAALIHVTC